jgi:hypothetical protein
LAQNAFRFDTKRVPFRYKTQFILAQNAIRFDTKRETTCTICDFLRLFLETSKQQ